MMSEKIREYYDAGVWSEARVKEAVKRGVISEEEYAKITGREYEE